MIMLTLITTTTTNNNNNNIHNHSPDLCKPATEAATYL